MTRTEQPRISVRRSGQDVALRQLYVALRAAYEALRHAQHVLAPFTITYHPGQRDSLPTRSATRLDALSRFTSGSSDVVEIPVHGATSRASFGHEEPVDLRDDLRTHMHHLRRLKEENRRLCEGVGRLVGERRSQPPRPCS